MKKKYSFRKRNFFFSILFSFILASMVYYRQHQLEQTQAEDQKLTLERKATSERLREGGRQLAEQMRLHPLKFPDDPFAEPAPSDAEELAQAKLWHQTPPSQRAKIFLDKPNE